MNNDPFTCSGEVSADTEPHRNTVNITVLQTLMTDVMKATDLTLHRINVISRLSIKSMRDRRIYFDSINMCRKESKGGTLKLEIPTLLL